MKHILFVHFIAYASNLTFIDYQRFKKDYSLISSTF